MTYSHESIQTTNGLPFRIFSFNEQNDGRFIPKHWHQSVEMIYCLSGQLKVWLITEEYILQKNDFMVINTNTVHATQGLKNSQVMIIQLPIQFLRDVTFGKYPNEFVFQINRTVMKNDYDDVVLTYFKQMAICSRYLKEGHKTHELLMNLHVMSDIYGLLAILGEHYADKTIAARRKLTFDRTRLIKVIDYLHDNFVNEITLASTANDFNFSTSYFSKFFQQGMGTSFTSYLRSIRLDAAFEKMMTSDLDLTTIAIDCGFESYRNFYNAFIEVYRVSPSEYRKMSTILRWKK